MSEEFFKKPYYVLDDGEPDPGVESAIYPDDATDCWFKQTPDGSVHLRKRPHVGNTLQTLTGASIGKYILGVHVWQGAKKVILVVDDVDSNLARVYELQSNGTLVEYTQPGPIRTWFITNEYSVWFTEGEDAAGTPWLYIAGIRHDNSLSVNMCYLKSTSTSIFDIPKTGTKSGIFAQFTNYGIYGPMTYINRRFIAAVDGTNKFIFTDTNPATGVIENDYWSSTDAPAVCESKADKLLHIMTHRNEIYCFGEQTTEIFYDDGATPFVPNRSAELNFGLFSRRSVVVIGDTIYALGQIDGRYCVVSIKDRQLKIISEAISAILPTLLTVLFNNLKCYSITVEGSAFYVMSFPAGYSWVYDIISDRWAKWTLPYYYGVFVPFWSSNNHLAMYDVAPFPRTIYIDRISTTLHSGITLTRRTPWINHNSWNRKKCDELYLKLRRGTTANESVNLKWCDDGEAFPASPYVIDIGSNSPNFSNDMISRHKRMGMYHHRRYELVIPDGCNTILTGAVENVQVLRD